MTTPNGSPPWEWTSSAQTYGGHPSKKNYQSQGVVNPRTDLDAADYNRMAVDLAALQRVGTFATLVIECDDTTPGPPTVLSINQMTESSSTPYVGDSPTHVSFPTLARVSDGRVTVTWPLAVADEYGVFGNLVLKYPRARILGAAGKVRTIPISDVAWDFEVLNMSDVAIANSKFILAIS